MVEYTQTVSHSWLVDVSQDGLTAKLQGVDGKSTTAFKLVPVCLPGIPQLTASGTVIPTKGGNWHGQAPNHAMRVLLGGGGGGGGGGCYMYTTASSPRSAKILAGSTDLTDNRVECTAYYPGSRGVAGINYVCHNAVELLQTPCSCHFPVEWCLLMTVLGLNFRLFAGKPFSIAYNAPPQLVRNAPITIL